MTFPLQVNKKNIKKWRMFQEYMEITTHFSVLIFPASNQIKRKSKMFHQSLLFDLEKNN